jgi:hypothetical protein
MCNIDVYLKQKEYELRVQIPPYRLWPLYACIRQGLLKKYYLLSPNTTSVHMT